MGHGITPSAALADWLAGVHEASKHWDPITLARALEEEGYETEHDLKLWLEDEDETVFKKALKEEYALKMPQIRKLIKALRALPDEPEQRPDRVLVFLGGERLKLEDEKKCVLRACCICRDVAVCVFERKTGGPGCVRAGLPLVF